MTHTEKGLGVEWGGDRGEGGISREGVLSAKLGGVCLGGREYQVITLTVRQLYSGTVHKVT